MDEAAAAGKGEITFPHPGVRLLVSRAWDGELSPAEAGWLEGHLRACGGCTEASTRFLAFLVRLEPYMERGLRPLSG